MYTDIKNFEDACQALNLNPETVLPDFSMFPEEDREAMVAHAKLVIITKALNLDENGKPYLPDWNNSNEYKYYPWFYVEASKEKRSGFGFSGAGFGGSGSCATVGSRLCSRSSEIALYAAEQFKDLYQAYLLMEQGKPATAEKRITVNVSLNINVAAGMSQEDISQQIGKELADAIRNVETSK